MSSDFLDVLALLLKGGWDGGRWLVCFDPERSATAEAFLIGFLRRDYGAAGLYDLSRQGMMDDVQLIVAMVTITLFVPCIANFMIMIKERGAKVALTMVAFIVPVAFLVGGVLNWTLRTLGVTF